MKIFVDLDSGTILNGPVVEVDADPDIFEGLSDSEVIDLARSLSS